MSKFLVDLDGVVDLMSKKSYKLSDVQDKIEKVAFDVVRFKDGNAEELWKIETGAEGESYIVALYNDDAEKVVTASAPKWSVMVKNADLHIFYKSDHICKVASSQLGFKPEDVNLAKKYLPKKLSENKSLVRALLKSANQNTVDSLLSKYPELK